jgi:hypothetical protein
MKKSVNRKKPFRRRTRKNKGSRKIKGGGLGWDTAIKFIEDNTLTAKDTMFKFIGPVIPNSNNNEYFIAKVSVTKFPYSFATIELTAENFDYNNYSKKIKSVSPNTHARLFNNLGFCKGIVSVTINAASTWGQVDCNKLNIYKPAFGRTHSNWFWNEWLQDIKMCRTDRGTACEINEPSAPASTA